jgi:putative redox protein
MAVSDQPKWAMSRSKAVWETGARSRAMVRQFPFIIDEPESFGGTNQGPRPTEYLLAAFCSCTIIMAERAAHELGIVLEQMDVDARGQLDQRGVTGEADVTPCFQRVEGKIRLAIRQGADRLPELRALVERRCPLHNTLVKSGAVVDMVWELM